MQILFEQQFQRSAALVCHALGRVNIIGDHADYNDGFMLPAAINYGTSLAASKREDRIVKVYAHSCGQKINEFSLDDITFDQEMIWSNYVKGTLQALITKHPEIKGVNLVVTGGCVLALMPNNLVTKVTDTIKSKYEQEFGLSLSIYHCTASQGAFR